MLETDPGIEGGYLGRSYLGLVAADSNGGLPGPPPPIMPGLPMVWGGPGACLVKVNVSVGIGPAGRLWGRRLGPRS